MPDGSIVVVEIAGERITRIARDGATATLAEVPGGPNGLAVGPDGAFYLCNNGRCFTFVDLGGSAAARPVRPRPLHRRPDPAGREGRVGHRSVHRVRRPTAAGAERPRDGRPRRLLLHGPRHRRQHHAQGGPRPRSTTRSATARGSTRSPIPTHAPERHRPEPRRLDPVLRRDVHRPRVPPQGGRAGRARSRSRSVELEPWALLAGLPGMELLDSLAVDDDGWVCVAAAGPRRHHVDLPRRRDDRAPLDRRPADDEHLLRRRRPRTPRS